MKNEILDSECGESIVLKQIFDIQKQNHMSKESRMIEERMDLGIAKRLIEDLIDLEKRISNEIRSIYWIKDTIKHRDEIEGSVSQKIETCEKMKEIYENLKVTIYEKLYFMVEAEMKHLGCLDHDKPQDTNTNTDAQHNGALESSSQEK